MIQYFILTTRISPIRLLKSHLHWHQKTDLASLKTKLDNFDADKFKTVATDLSKVTNVMNNDVVKRTVYDKFVTKANVIDTKIPSTGGLAPKTQYNSD